jgi:hypothetical protein
MISNQTAMLPAGDSGTIVIPIANPEDRDLNGASAFYALAERANASEKFRKSTESGTAILEEVDGVWTITVSITPADTKNLKPTTYYHEAAIVDAEGAVSTVMRGNFVLTPTLVARALQT